MATLEDFYPAAGGSFDPTTRTTMGGAIDFRTADDGNGRAGFTIDVDNSKDLADIYAPGSKITGLIGLSSLDPGGFKTSWLWRDLLYANFTNTSVYLGLHTASSITAGEGGDIDLTFATPHGFKPWAQSQNVIFDENHVRLSWFDGTITVVSPTVVILSSGIVSQLNGAGVDLLTGGLAFATQSTFEVDSSADIVNDHVDNGGSFAYYANYTSNTTAIDAGLPMKSL